MRLGPPTETPWRWLQWALAAIVLLSPIPSMVQNGPSWWSLTALPAAFLVLILDRFPRTGATGLALGVLLGSITDEFTAPVIAGTLSVALFLARSRLRCVAVIIAGCLSEITLHLLNSDNPAGPDWLPTIILLIVAIVLGMILQSSHRRTLMVQTAHAEALRTQRSLIARELHDTLARANTRVYLRAQGALSASAEQPEVAALLEDIAETSRSSVTELRAMLRVLREDAPAQPDTAPATDLGAAFSSARSTLRRAGLRVTTTHNGRLTGLPATVAATLVLAIDEAVTCLRTCAATDTRSQLVLEVGRSRADLLAMCRIADRYSPHDHELTDRAGLLGLGERAHALEGTFDCAVVGRQWLLTLSLPLAAKKSPSAT
mgnify:FL=1